MKYLLVILLLYALSPQSLQANERATTALIKAIKHNNYNAAKEALSFNADVETKNLGSYTLLTYVSLHNQYDIAKLLIKNNANINRFDSIMSPMHAAAKKEIPSSRSKLKLIKLLVENGADFDAPDRKNYTPLAYATLSKQDDVVEYLLSIGANPHTKSPKGIPLDIAQAQKNMHLAILIEKSMNKTVHNKGHTMVKELEAVVDDFYDTNLSGSSTTYERNRTQGMINKMLNVFKGKVTPDKIPQHIKNATIKQNKALKEGKFIHFRLSPHYALHHLTYNNARARLIYTSNTQEENPNILVIMFHNKNNLWKIHDILAKKLTTTSTEDSPPLIQATINKMTQHPQLKMR